MRSVVRDNWLAFTEPLEGGIPYPYADILGLVTIAYGNLVDPLSVFLRLPLMLPGGVPASTAEKASAFQAVKNDRDAARYGHRYAASLTKVRLTREGMADLALRKLDSNDAALARRLAGWDDMPACAQMAMHSLAWACGSRARFPKLFSAVNAGDFDAAAVYIHINADGPDRIRGTADDNRGLDVRNVANKVLMRNAARVRDFRLDPDTLDWTHDLSVSAIPTQPSPLAEEVTGSGPTVHAFPDTVTPAQDREPE